MITYSKLGEYGRMGNQLFQYAMLKVVSLERGYKMKIPDPNTVECQNQKCQLDQFNIKCDYLSDGDMPTIQHRFVEPNHSKFWPQVFLVKDNTDFMGYYQNYLYFAKYEKQIREEFKLNIDLENYAKEYVGNLKKKNEQIISVHFRRGDAVKVPRGETRPGMSYDYFGKNDVLSKESVFGKYFFNAIDNFNNNNIKFLVFSGGTRKGFKHNQGDMKWCRNNIKDNRFLFCEGHNDIEDFAIMKSCDHNIITHSTSYGYWAAFLNENVDKIVYAPKNYTIPDDGRVQQGFYPKTWKTI